ncbi:hypothetical protein [Vibrio alginolyticus]|uniref:hypothetical protein n=1 Tax=Vibrio TaxID=662 RepID=UPI0006CAA9DF|nr:hypothetical protein [Vibrio alginolyticus]KPM97441.1 hypothetical protein AOG25_13265 [Vibrio alginolyticus]CAH7182438.1 conserved hypothetical protein [Vibrio chagasii]CAH7351695.1 conserved hypothetical protein [Vibrio chagasii]
MSNKQFNIKVMKLNLSYHLLAFLSLGFIMIFIQPQIRGEAFLLLVALGLGTFVSFAELKQQSHYLLVKVVVACLTLLAVSEHSETIYLNLFRESKFGLEDWFMNIGHMTAFSPNEGLQIVQITSICLWAGTFALKKTS